MSKKAAYFTLLGAIVDLLPEDYAAKALLLYPGTSPTTIINTVDGRAKDLSLLVKIAEAAIPGFKIPKYVIVHL